MTGNSLAESTETETRFVSVAQYGYGRGVSAKAALAYRSIALAGSPDAALRAGLAAIRELTSAAAAVWVSRIDGLPFSVVDQVGLEPGGLAAWSGAGPHLAELIQSNGGPLTFHSDRAERDGGLPRVLSTRARHDVIGIPSSRSDNAVVMCVVERDRAPDIGLDGDDWPAEVADIIGFTDDRRAELTESQLLRDGVVALEGRELGGLRLVVGCRTQPGLGVPDVEHGAVGGQGRETVGVGAGVFLGSHGSNLAGRG